MSFPVGLQMYITVFNSVPWLQKRVSPALYGIRCAMGDARLAPWYPGNCSHASAVQRLRWCLAQSLHNWRKAGTP